MASAQEPGLIRMYAQDPSGNKKKIFQARVEDTAPAGGASDGASANVATPEKRITVASPVKLFNDWTLLVTYEPDAADSIDASDCIWSIPVTTPSGSNQLGRDQFQSPALSDQSLVANREVTLAGYKVTEGSLTLGPGKLFLDIQDDTA
jgi:hypothetical protein